MTLDMDMTKILFLQTGVIVLLSVLYVVISLVAVLGNSTVIFIVCTSRRMQVSLGGDYLHYFVFLPAHFHLLYSMFSNKWSFKVS